MKTDNPTALCVAFSPDQMALIQQQAAAHGVSPEDWVRETVRKALATERVSVGASPEGTDLSWFRQCWKGR